MSLQSRLDALITAIGADIKALQNKINTKVTTTDLSTTAQTAGNISELAFTPSVGVYVVEIYLMYTSAASTTAGWFTLKWPTGLGTVAWIVNESASAGTRFNQSSSGVLSNGTAGPSGVARMVQGIAIVTVTTADGDIVPAFASEVAASLVTVKTGSMIRYQKIA